jgi:hypothetical protein
VVLNLSWLVQRVLHSLQRGASVDALMPLPTPRRLSEFRRLMASVSSRQVGSTFLPML